MKYSITDKDPSKVKSELDLQTTPVGLSIEETSDQEIFKVIVYPQNSTRQVSRETLKKLTEKGLITEKPS